MPVVRFRTRAGRPVVFKTNARNPGPVMRLSPALEKARQALTDAEAAHKAKPTMVSGVRVDQARQKFADMIRRRYRR